MKLKGLDYLDISNHFSEEEIMVQHNTREFVDNEISPIIEKYFHDGTFPNELGPPPYKSDSLWDADPWYPGSFGYRGLACPGPGIDSHPDGGDGGGAGSSRRRHPGPTRNNGPATQEFTYLDLFHPGGIEVLVRFLPGQVSA